MPTQPTYLPLLQPSLLTDTPYSPPIVYNSSHHHKSIPKFDLIELAGSFSLCGELPGVQPNDIELEFSNPQTISIRGHTRRSYKFCTPSTGVTTEIATVRAGGKASKSYEVPVEGENVSMEDVCNATPEPLQAGIFPDKYWLSERSIGEFSRSFLFHVRIDHEHVQASMTNGLLSIIVPKA
ncbi:hypothetical protein V502_01142 [Pseudogymnoascus sp. VKM F-4520 (FW-2644)]|nr:hypothetical protein V502_01142 [Pseudogymnoascus sp. VKM F-4520 (FW-2644)]